jgi:hypothetical protein
MTLNQAAVSQRGRQKKKEDKIGLSSKFKTFARHGGSQP